jgi:DNA-binding CsgD family transcriptional regulator/tetratricopeptide (TPR) repeat protein
MLDRVREGESAVLVMRGEAGIGKTALLRYCARQASSCRVAQIAGVASELEMPFAALHQLCAPMLADLPALPEPQQQALRVAFGLSTGNPPDLFMVGLAALGLLAEAAAKRPLACLVDDAQWLDEPSRRVLAFVGRRLLAEAILLLLAVREAGDERLFPALPTLPLGGLTDEDAQALLVAAVPGHLDDQVRDRIVAETGGNPLALLELARGLSKAELAGGFGEADPNMVAVQTEDHYVRHVRALSGPTQRLTMLAAADPTGDATLVWRAAETLGVPRSQAVAAEAAQLVEIGSQVHFRHPLVRSAAYAAAAPEDRRAAHLALAAATDVNVDPERRVWHLAAAAIEPDEALASELERMAGTAQSRAGLVGAAAFLQRSIALTADPGRRADRALAAAEAHLHAGTFDTALGLLAQAQADAVADLQRARVEQLRGQVEWASNPGRRAPLVLSRAAARLEVLDVRIARETYLHAWLASGIAGPLAESGGDLATIARAALAVAGPSPPPRPCDLLLDGLATVVTDGHNAAQGSLRRAADAFLDNEVSVDDWIKWGILAQTAAMALWDIDTWVVLGSRHVEVARASGALSALSIALNGEGNVATLCGDFETARAAGAEKDVISDVTGTRLSSTLDLLLAGYEGRPATAIPFLSATVTDSVARGEGLGVQQANWASAILHNALGRYQDALVAAEQAAEPTNQPIAIPLVLPELIEAAVRSGKTAVAEDGLRRLSAMVIEGSDWAAGLETRGRALVTKGEEAERWYRASIDCLARTPLVPDLARTRLLYGEWLRRQGRRVDSRQQLGLAYDAFTAMGAEGFAERARNELLATGEKVRKRHFDTDNDLTPQEEHIARLARDGRSNAEIGAELFLSIRTVEWHLRKVFTKLGITSRRELKGALPSRGRSTAPAWQPSEN